MTGPRRILAKYGIRPRKRLGQSFLEDANMASKIVEKSGIGIHDTVLEIGAGCGTMTSMIASRARHVIAIDVDPRMVRILEEELSGIGNVSVVEADILAYDFTKASTGVGSPIRIIGNIPYNISTQILFRLVDMRQYVSDMVLMFQREVAERIIATPGSRDYGILTVMASMYTEVSKLMSVPARCFYPKPEVESAVLRLAVRKDPAAPLSNHDLFRTVVRTSFSKRRKTLLNNLKSLAPEGRMQKLLNDCGIDSSRRAETLNAREFALITDALDATNCLTK